MLKSLALSIPPIRRLYEQRNALLVQVADLNNRLVITEGRHVALGEERQRLNQALYAAREREKAIRKEIEVCRKLSNRCVFIFGFARSNTTITSQILNVAKNVFLLNEANFYLPKDVARWRDWYNAQHVSFRNQATKSTYAPDFIPERDHTWWEWLDAASTYFDILGDKIAFSSYHFGETGEETIRSFFEARFFDAKYIFLIRNPVDTLLSLAKLAGITDDTQMVRECDAWLRYMQFWADSIRIFPNTLTLLADEFETQTIQVLASFTGLCLDGAELLLNVNNKRKHELPIHFQTLVSLKGEMFEIFDLAKAALSQESALWQAVQKRSAEENNSKGETPGQIAIVSQPLGQVWIQAQQLRAKLSIALGIG